MNRINIEKILTITPQFLKGEAGVIARYDVPTLKLSSASSPLDTAKTVDTWNAFFADSFPGAGYYAADPMADITDPENYHFVLFASDVFLKAFSRSFDHIEVNDIPMETIELTCANEDSHYAQKSA